MPPVPPTCQLRERPTSDERASARSEAPSQPISTKPPSGRHTPTYLRQAPLAELGWKAWQNSVTCPSIRHIISAACPSAFVKSKPR